MTLDQWWISLPCPGKDGSVWTTADHASSIKLSGEEAATIGRVFTSADFTAFQASGIVVEGVKYQFLRLVG